MLEKEKRKDLAVFVQNHDSATCAECGAELLKGDLARFEREKGLICLECSDLDHLEFLPSGDVAITRRSAKYSTLWAVVLKFSRTRRRNERQGILAEPEAIDRAIAESEADSDDRERRREREAIRRENLDRNYVAAFARAIREEFPSIPAGVDTKIAEHACLKHSGRVGRSADAKAFEPKTVFLAVQAHVRHAYTDYDRLLFEYDDRQLARESVRGEIDAILSEWRTAS